MYSIGKISPRMKVKLRDYVTMVLLLLLPINGQDYQAYYANFENYAVTSNITYMNEYHHNNNFILTLYNMEGTSMVYKTVRSKVFTFQAYFFINDLFRCNLQGFNF